MNTETNYAAIFYSEIENDTEILEKNVSDHPSSSLSRFLLLYNYKKNNDPRFEEFAQQTAIYLYNPLWIQLLLSNADENGNIYRNGALYLNPGNEKIDSIENQEVSNHINIEQKEQELPVNEPINEIVNLDHSNIESAIVPLNIENTKPKIEKTVTLGTSLDKSHPDELNKFQEIQNENNLDNEVSNHINIEQKEPDLPLSDSINEVAKLHQSNLHITILPLSTENTSSQIEKTVTLGTSLDESHHEELSKLQEDKNENNNDNNESTQTGKEPLKFDIEESPTPVNEQIRETLTLGVDLNEKKREEILESPEDEKVSSEKEDVLYDSKISINDTSDHLTESLGENVVSNEENGPKEEKQLELNTTENTETDDNDSDEDEIEFEPLHTVDYFASQGIKIPEEVLQNDALGKQVKSFTAWLKSMKKLHPGQLPEQNEVIERIIQASSEVSNQNAHVLTEAMAEVLLKQGKKEKAIEMYEKLSLLNPSKSAYFAAKIESLKII